ncbi:hypothetical protein [Bradyrhizobium sp. CCBAU 11434]|uniref:hypothetical protein n=1 Tax=Bradyrhizobium sp. CCBAU 11434 TaxID=1630885 RepID=UPI002305F957|nr:hypothetical protein [Bradyrhizobium sp. CCBAU 11434]
MPDEDSVTFCPALSGCPAAGMDASAAPQLYKKMDLPTNVHANPVPTIGKDWFTSLVLIPMARMSCF